MRTRLKSIVSIALAFTFAFFAAVHAELTMATETETTSPVISDVSVSEITSTSATITWTTDEPARHRMDFGTTTSYGTSLLWSYYYYTSHSVTLSGLTHDTTYHFVVYAGRSRSPDHTFTTKADNIPPVISNVTVVGVTSTTATITWITDEPATGWVEFTAPTSITGGDPLGDLTTSHSVRFIALTPSTTYHFRVKSVDVVGNESVSFDHVFTTVTGIGLASAPWPKFRHDLQNTGRSSSPSISSPKLNWTYPTRGEVYSSPAIASDGTVYFSSHDRNLYAINPDGTLKWSYTTGAYVKSPMIASDGTVYFGSGLKLYALNPDGTLKWSYGTNGGVGYSPSIASDGTVYFGSGDYNFYAINPDGTLRWSYTTGGAVYSSPAIASDGTVYVGSLDKKIYAINSDGTLKWSYPTGDWIHSSPAIASDGTIYVGSYDDNLYAINPDGTLRWSYTTRGDVGSSPAIASDGTIYVGNYTTPFIWEEGKLYAINPDGTLKWSYATGSDVSSSPAIASDGTIYVGSHDRNLYAINPDGTLKWSYATEGYVYSSPAIASDGTVYFGSTNGRLYAIGERQPTILTISSLSFTLQRGNSITLTATLNDNANNPLANKTISWSKTVGSLSATSATTNSYGQVLVTYTAPTVSAQTSVTVSASFVGDSEYGGSSGTSSGTITVTPVPENLPLAVDEIALTLDDLPSWSLVGQYSIPTGPQLYSKFAKENCGEIDQTIYVRSSAEEAEADFRGTHFTDERWLVDHQTIGDESELWIHQNVAHARFRVQNVYVQIVLWIQYSDFETNPPLKDYIIWLAEVVESRILDLPEPSLVNLFVDWDLPIARIDSPSHNSILKDVITVCVAGSDTNFQTMELYIDENLKQTWTMSGTQTYGWDTTTYTEGEHSLKLIVHDAVGNIAETSVIVIVNNIPDDDGDNILDEWELLYGLNPQDPSDAYSDLDGDGLSNLEEYDCGTNPTQADTDDDELSDGVEIRTGSNPLNWDSDGDGVGDGIEFAINFESCEAEPLPDNSIKVQVFWASYRMDVVSNSTVLGATFDSSSGQLTVRVDGSDGTTGTCDITVPKNLISSDSDISVYLDDQPLSFTLTQDETYYHLHMEYAHSEHSLEVSFGTLNVAPGSTPIIWIITFLVITGGGIFAVYFVKKRQLL